VERGKIIEPWRSLSREKPVEISPLNPVYWRWITPQNMIKPKRPKPVTCARRMPVSPSIDIMPMKIPHATSPLTAISANIRAKVSKLILEIEAIVLYTQIG
jgi:hypothetical protein